jgi:hypothetical protein
MVSLVSMPSRFVVHHDSPNGFYAPKVFRDFALGKFPARLDEIGASGDYEVIDGYGKDRTLYHYPGANMGLVYFPISPERCEVDLIGMPSEPLLRMLVFVLEESFRRR